MADKKWIENEEQLQTQINDLKIDYQACMTVTVTVLRGRNISVGWLHDFFDIPDSQVYVKCKTAVGRKSFKTKIGKNSKNPEWNESFTFILPEGSNNHPIQVDVYEEDRFKHDPHLGVMEFNTRDLEMDKPKPFTLDMKSNGQVDIEMLKRLRTAPDFRLSLGLSEEERKFRIERKPKTMKALQELLGLKDGPKNLSETPTIAVAITGGGYRAVATSCGAMEALAENNLVDTLMYIAGLSGSSWYISTSYFHKSMTNLDSLIKHHDWLRERMEKSLTKYLFDLSFHFRYGEYKKFKRENHQSTTFVDFYGLTLGETFLGIENTKFPLSSLQDYVKTSDVPFPILSCAHVRDHLPMSAFWDEVEMTPFEVSLPSYGFNVQTKNFNSSWGNGILQQNLPEPPLHYIMGTSGSAFAIMWGKISDKNEIGAKLQDYIDAQQESHHEEKEGQTDAEESESEEEEEEEEPGKLRQKDEDDDDNFASNDDKWIESVRKRVQHQQNTEQSTIGRNFILGRTAKVKSCATGYQKIQKFLFNTEPVPENLNASARFNKKMSTKKIEMSLCDSALGCNLPSIYVARPQRTVDVLIVVDCSNYKTESSLMMEIFATVQSQVHDHGIKFPRISIEKIAEDPFREFYLFEDTEDPECPIVLWFTLSNEKFSKLEKPHRRPGYPQPDAVDSGEEKFNDFMIYPESSDYGTLRVSFTPLKFDRLRELMRYNIVSNMEIIKEKIAEKVQQKRARM